MRVLAALLILPAVLGVNQVCPDGGTCSDTDTCCRVQGGGYGCCPLVDAVCCGDLTGCCPANEVCFWNWCLGVKDGNRSMSKKTPLKMTGSDVGPLKITGSDVVCPDGGATCPDDTTCCKNPPGQTPEYGCCPMADAVCCEDGFHCCPSGTTCDVAEGKCQGDGFITEMYRKKPLRPQTGLARIRLSNGPSVGAMCNGTSVQCPDSGTCCMTQSGEWGCCPFANARCSEDKIHCCPENMHYDAISQHCNEETADGTILRKTPAHSILHDVHVICPDKTACDSSDTCCEVRDGVFGCCPYPNATCCADDLHCCPSGTRCDASSTGCVQESWISVEENEIARN